MENHTSMELERELIKQLKGIRRELEKISKTLAKDRKNEKTNYYRGSQLDAGDPYDG